MAESTMDQTVPVSLRDQELLDKGRNLANKLAVRDGMVSAKKQAAKEAQEEIDELDGEISRLAESIRTGFENRKQGDLFADQALAAGALAEVAKAACTCDPETPGVHAIDCPTHGCVGTAAAPREKRTMGECGTCGKPLVEARDHQAGGEVIGWTCENTECEDAGATSARYRHAAQGAGLPDACALCELPESDLIHAPVAEEQAQEGEATEAAHAGPEDEETDDETPIVEPAPEEATDEVSRKRRSRRRAEVGA